MNHDRRSHKRPTHGLLLHTRHESSLPTLEQWCHFSPRHQVLCLTESVQSFHGSWALQVNNLRAAHFTWARQDDVSVVAMALPADTGCVQRRSGRPPHVIGHRWLLVHGRLAVLGPHACTVIREPATCGIARPPPSFRLQTDRNGASALHQVEEVDRARSSRAGNYPSLALLFPSSN